MTCNETILRTGNSVRLHIDLVAFIFLKLCIASLSVHDKQFLADRICPGISTECHNRKRTERIAGDDQTLVTIKYEDLSGEGNILDVMFAEDKPKQDTVPPEQEDSSTGTQTDQAPSQGESGNDSADNSEDMLPIIAVSEPDGDTGPAGFAEDDAGGVVGSVFTGRIRE